MLKSLQVQRIAINQAEQIHFHGWLPRAELLRHYQSADIFVLPSDDEGMSYALLEAMSCGLPVAASAVGGLPEIIDDQVGALFEPANPSALADSVVALLKRADLGELGEEGRRRVVSNWSQNRMVDRHLEIYGELLDEAKEPKR